MTKDKIRILAFDISASPGVAVVEIAQGKPKLIAVDNVVTDAKFTDAQRYVYVQSFMTQFIHENGVYDAVVREKFIKGGSKRSTQLVFGAWSSVDRALASYGYQIDEKDELVASTIKKNVGGKGGASKEEVAQGVIKALGKGVKEAIYTPKGRLIDDRADAIAVALAWAKREGYLK